MIKINGFSVVHWKHNNSWFVCFPDGSGLGIPDKYSLRVVLKHVLFWIKYGITNCFDAHFAHLALYDGTDSLFVYTK